MSNAQAVAFLSLGLIIPESVTPPIPYDVRSGVDNGAGQPGTLTSPSEADVEAGVQYGGDGDQYTGTLYVPQPSSGSAVVLRWKRLYDAQSRDLGEYIVATIAGFCISKPAIISAIDIDAQFIEGGVAEGGGWNIQMRLSDLSGEPPKGTSITCNGEAAGSPLEVLNFQRNNGIAYITAVDFSAQNS